MAPDAEYIQQRDSITAILPHLDKLIASYRRCKAPPSLVALMHSTQLQLKGELESIQDYLSDTVR